MQKNRLYFTVRIIGYQLHKLSGT